jgi:hypothetical protein
MTRTEVVLEALVYSPLNHLTRLRAQEYVTEFSRRESFKFGRYFVTDVPVQRIYRTCKGQDI